MYETKRSFTWAEVADEEENLDRAVLIAVQQELHGMQQVVRSEEQEQDPLGVLTQNEFQKLERQAKANKIYTYVSLESDKFRPSSFLNHYHKNTPPSKFQGASKHLSEKVKTGTEQVKALVDENFGTFIRCKDQIDRVISVFDDKQYQCDPESSVTGQLRSSFKKAHEEMNSVYGDLLVRKKAIESKRGLLSLLSRFQFIFKLVGVLKDAIEKNEYDRAIRDYRKAKALVGQSHHEIFQRIIIEVEKIMQELKKELFLKLENPNTPIEEQEKIIGYIAEIDPDSQPAWYFVDAQHKNVISSLNMHVSAFEKAQEGVARWYEEQKKSDKVWRDLQNTSSLQTLIASADTGEIDSIAMDAYNILDSHVAKHIRKFTSAFIKAGGDFWKLVQSVKSGDFAKGSNTVSTDNIGRANTMMVTILQTYTSRLHTMFFPKDNKKVAHDDEFDSFEEVMDKIRAQQSLRPFMKEVIRDIGRCQRVVQGWGLSTFSLRQFYGSLTHIISFYVKETCAKTLSDIRNLPTLAIETNENENFNSDDSPVFHVRNEIRQIIPSALRSIQGLVGEKDDLQTDVQSFFYDTLNYYLDCLHYFAFGFDYETFYASKGCQSFSDIFLLTTLECCVQARTLDFPALFGEYKELFSSLSKERIKAAEKITKDLESLIMSTYVARRSIKQSNMIKNGVLLCGMDWNSKTEPTDIRPYVHEFLVDMVLVHSNVYNVAADHTETITSRLIENAMQTIYDCLKMVDFIGTYSALQIKAEIEAINQVLSRFQNPALNSLGVSINKYIEQVSSEPKSSPANQRTLDAIRNRLIDGFQKRSKLQYVCFQLS